MGETRQDGDEREPTRGPTESGLALRPQIVASMTLGVREMLVARGAFGEVERLLDRRHPELLLTIERAAWRDWISAYDHAALATAAADVIGLPPLRALGAARLADAEVVSGPIAPVARAWARAYPAELDKLARVGPHLWSSTTRGAGTMAVAREAPGVVVLRVTGCPLFAATPGWQALVAGLADGIVALSPVKATIEIEHDAESVDLVTRW